jgi:hypothetical protein
MRLRALRALAVALAAAGLVACVTARAQERGAPGLGEAQVAESRARVAFRGNTLMSRGAVEDMALYRAAELTLAQGYDHFVVVARRTDARSRLQGYGGTAYALNRRGWSYPARPGAWRSWYEPAFKTDAAYRQITEFEASAEIRMLRGPGDPAALDAREVKARLAARAALLAR